MYDIAGEAVWLCREAVLSCLERGIDCGGRDAWMRASYEEGCSTWLCEVEEDVLVCLRLAGIEKPDPESKEISLTGSCVDVPAEVEEVLDATEALWATRRMDSSRVSRFT
jgi:hypothetical protein